MYSAMDTISELTQVGSGILSAFRRSLEDGGPAMALPSLLFLTVAIFLAFVLPVVCVNVECGPCSCAYTHWRGLWTIWSTTPQAVEWTRDVTRDGDVESNPGPDVALTFVACVVTFLAMWAQRRRFAAAVDIRHSESGTDEIDVRVVAHPRQARVTRVEYTEDAMEITPYLADSSSSCSDDDSSDDGSMPELGPLPLADLDDDNEVVFEPPLTEPHSYVVSYIEPVWFISARDDHGLARARFLIMTGVWDVVVLAFADGRTTRRWASRETMALYTQAGPIARSIFCAWVRDLCRDGDVESNPGPPSFPGVGRVLGDRTVGFGLQDLMVLAQPGTVVHASVRAAAAVHSMINATSVAQRVSVCVLWLTERELGYAADLVEFVAQVVRDLCEPQQSLMSKLAELSAAVVAIGAMRWAPASLRDLGTYVANMRADWDLSTVPGLVHSILRVVRGIASDVMAYARGERSAWDVFFGESPERVVLDAQEYLESDVRLGSDITRFERVREGHSLLARLKAMRMEPGLPVLAKATVQTRVAAKLRADEAALHGMGTSVMPYCVWLVGPPGLGKTTMAQYMHKVVMGILGRAYDHAALYSVSMSEKYVEHGIVPSAVVTLLLDEFNAVHSNMRNGAQPWPLFVLNAVGPQPLHVSRAFDKSNGTITPSLVVLTSNSEVMNAAEYVNNPEAVADRIRCVVHITNNGWDYDQFDRADPLRAARAAGRNEDNWLTYMVCDIGPTDDGTKHVEYGPTRIRHTFHTRTEFDAWFRNEVTTYLVASRAAWARRLASEYVTMCTNGMAWAEGHRCPGGCEQRAAPDCCNLGVPTFGHWRGDRGLVQCALNCRPEEEVQLVEEVIAERPKSLLALVGLTIVMPWIMLSVGIGVGVGAVAPHLIPFLVGAQWLSHFGGYVAVASGLGAWFWTKYALALARYGVPLPPQRPPTFTAGLDVFAWWTTVCCMPFTRFAWVRRLSYGIVRYAIRARLAVLQIRAVWIIGALGAAISAVGLWTLYRTEEEKERGARQMMAVGGVGGGFVTDRIETPLSNPPHPGRAPRVWRTPDAFEPRVRGAKGDADLAQLAESLVVSLTVIIDRDGVSHDQHHGVGVRTPAGIITVRHLFPRDQSRFDVRVVFKPHAQPEDYQVVLDRHVFFDSSGRDLALIHLPGKVYSASSQALVNALPESPRTDFVGGGHLVRPPTALATIWDRHAQVEDEPGRVIVQRGVETLPGWSGSVALGGGWWLGLHVRAGGVALLMDRGMYDRLASCAVAQNPGAEQCARGVLGLKESPYESSVTRAVDAKNPFNHATFDAVPAGGVPGIGKTTTGFVTQPALGHKYVVDKIIAEQGCDYACPRDVKVLDPALGYKIDAYGRAVLGMCTEGIAVHDLVDRCVVAFQKDLEGPLELCRPYTVDEALRNIVGKTSSGGLWGLEGMSPKDKLVNEVGEMNPEWMLQVGTIIDRLKEGYVVPCQTRWTLKDEKRAATKVAEAKIRVFEVCDSTYNFVCAMFLMPVLLAMAADWKRTGICVGMRALSPEWGERFRWMVWDGEAFQTVADPDAKEYDKRQREWLYNAVARVCMWYAVHRMGYSPADASVVFLLVVGFIHRWISLHGDWFFVTRAGPSGGCGTSEINSLGMAILLRMAFVVVTQMAPEEFTKYVRALIYGDDMAAGIRRLPEFNQLTMAKAYTIFGHELTANDKKSALVPYRNGNEVTFLKRRFLRIPGESRMRAPLAKGSIWGMLGWETPTGNITKQQRFIQVGPNAVREAWLWGDDFYDEVYAVVMAIAADPEVSVTSLVLPTKEELRVEFESGNMTTWDA